MPEPVGGVDFTTLDFLGLDFLGLILGATGSIDDMSACLELIVALADDFVALRVRRGNLGRGGGGIFRAMPLRWRQRSFLQAKAGQAFRGGGFSGIGW